MSFVGVSAAFLGLGAKTTNLSETGSFISASTDSSSETIANRFIWQKSQNMGSVVPIGPKGNWLIRSK